MHEGAVRPCDGFCSLSSARLQLNTIYLLATCATADAVETLGQGMVFFASRLVDRLDVDREQLVAQVEKGPGARYLRSREEGYDAVARRSVP
ncbi:hypothetical protein [Paracidovorax valerianellae]|uniref:hypothetical protein n=1 Tax=Paracidovorax valerianellae TaxID=187868 RepID=UPI000B82718C|nr:hypothetical protein [Paracidovorax valerianellae]